jgi:hypothetical protein
MPSVGAGAFALAVAGCLCMIASSRRPLQPCIPYMNMPDGDLPNMPLTLPNSTAWSGLRQPLLQRWPPLSLHGAALTMR